MITKTTELVNISLTLVKVHPGKKYSTMVIEATITRNNTHTTMVRAEGLEHDLRQTRFQHYFTIYKCRLKSSSSVYEKDVDGGAAADRGNQHKASIWYFIP